MAYVDHSFSIADEDLMIETSHSLSIHPPIKEIIFAIALLIFGFFSIMTGVIMAAHRIDRIHGIFFAGLGLVLFLPGFYYTRMAYYAYKGYKDFSPV